jgi:uncharacterized membrane protein
MEALIIFMAAAEFAVRLMVLRGLWRLPLKNGEGFFLAQRVGPGFYQGAGAPLLRRYRISLVVPVILDAPLALWFIAGQKYTPLFFQQIIAVVATFVVYNVIATHFNYRAMALAAPEENPPATIQISMEPRRLRDHTNLAVEVVIALAVALAIALLAWSASLPTHHGIRGGVVLTIWILYLQLGLLLLKGVFVRWRMALPARRTEDFRRWRSTWLSYHLKLFDAIRVLSALVLVSTVQLRLHVPVTRPSIIIVGSVWAVILGVYIYYVARENRRMRAVEREIKPIELVKEFPRRPVPEGRFLAGGLLYFNRDNPGVLVRSAQGIAINLARPTAYLWPAYFIGMATLMIWMAR